VRCALAAAGRTPALCRPRVDRAPLQWEEADNKPVVAAYGVGALAALFITEW
jgi:hypothetical protein